MEAERQLRSVRAQLLGKILLLQEKLRNGENVDIRSVIDSLMEMVNHIRL